MLNWQELSHAELVAMLKSGLAERDTRVKALEALTGPKVGRPKNGRGDEFPDNARGALDGEVSS